MQLTKIAYIPKIFLFLPALLSMHITVASEFPLRSKYSEVPVYSAEELKRDFGKAIIVDVRTQFEYSIVHIKGALHNSVTFTTFVDKLSRIRDKDGSRKIVFYCNGYTCGKSYKAVVKASKAGFKNVYAYDAGIFTWIKKYPDLAKLLGRSPVNQESIIKKNALKVKMLNYNEFHSMASKNGSFVIDIRDPKQRKVKLNIKSQNIYLDKLVAFLKGGVWKNRQLLIYDAVGKQVRWLQYVLIANGYTNYYFLDKGARGVVSVQAKN